MGVAAEDLRQLRDDFFAFADDDRVEKGRHRFRVHGDAGAAGDDQRPGGAGGCGLVRACGGQGRDAGLQQHLHHIEVIHLVRNGEGQDIKIVQVALRLQRDERAAGLASALVPKDAFANDIGQGVEGLIDDLQRQAGHAHVVSVRKGQGNAQASAPIFEDGAAFFGELRFGLRDLVPLHAW